MPGDRSICGLILAGGLSTRMGRDKATLLHPDGRTLIARCRDLLLHAGCGIVAISLRADQEVPVGFDDGATTLVFRDPIGKSHGPMAGIVSALQYKPAADWLVIACDLPRLDVATLTNLLRNKRDGEAFLSYRSEFDDLPEPLCALYSEEALPFFEEALATDFRCPRKILIRNYCRLLEPVTPGALHNANTPEEWEGATR